MRAAIFIICAMVVMLVQVFLGGKAFFPEAFTRKDATLEEILEKIPPVLETASPEDIAWIAGNPVINVGVDANFYPLEMFDERGRYTGLGGDYLKILEKGTGLTFRPAAAGSWAETEEKAREGKIDLLMAAAKTGRRSEFFLFTAPYVNLPGIIMTKRDSEAAQMDLDKLAGKRVAVVNGYSWHDFLREHHPEIQPVPAENTLAAIEKVLNGEADAVLDYEFNLLEKIQTSGLLQMRRAGAVNTNYGHALAVNKGRPELFNIISLAMRQISPEMQARLSEKWLKAQKPADRQKRLQWLFFFLVESLLLSLLAWRLVRREGRRLALQYLACRGIKA